MAGNSAHISLVVQTQFEQRCSQASGHAWIGETVVRHFQRKPYQATIRKWQPAMGDDEALWHVEYDDGDAEDLDEGEVLKALDAATRCPLHQDTFEWCSSGVGDFC